MSTPSSSGSTADRRWSNGGPSPETILTFVVGLAIVLVAGAVVGPRTDSYVAVAFAAYFLTTVYDLVVDRLEYRESLLTRVREGGDADAAAD